MYEKCGSELERPYPSPKGKKKAYKLGEVVFSDGRESERNIVPIMTVQDNAVYGKVPYFIHVCREGKSERMSCRLITPKGINRKKLVPFVLLCVQRSWTTLAGVSPVTVIASEPCS